MSRLSTSCTLLAALCAIACTPASESSSETMSPAAPPSAVAAPAAAVPNNPAQWAGKWVGPEGLFVEIGPAAGGTFTLTMQSDLDTRGTYEGKPVEGGIAFERGGQQLLLRPASGDETGLKYLAGKQDCLMVAPGEGYCRD
jgi:hypothetical protein